MPRILVVAVFVLSFCLAGAAQQQPDKAQSAADSPSDVVLHDGQEVVLRSIELIASNKSQAGETVRFEVIRAVSSDGVVAIPLHSIAVGRITSAEHAKLAHHGGKLTLAIESVQLANGEYAPLRAVESRKERNFGWHDVGVATVVAATLYYMPLAPMYLLGKGKEVSIPAGARFTAFVDGDVKLDRSSLGANTPAAEMNSNIATIYVFRGNQDKDPGFDQPVSCGRYYLGDLTGSQYLEFKVPRGRYWIYAGSPFTKLSKPQQQSALVTLAVEAGQSYYLEVSRIPAKWKVPTVTLKQVDAALGGEQVFNAQDALVLPAEQTLHEAKLGAVPKGVKSN